MRSGDHHSAGGCFRLAAATRLPLLALAMASAVTASGGGDGDLPSTVIDDVVMYGVNDDTHELLRYAFGSDDYYVVGPVIDDEGDFVHEIEALGYIPSGPHKGLYGVTNYDGNERSKLVKFNMFTASVTVYADDIGYGNIEGMVAIPHPGTGEWTLYATQSGDTPEGEDKVTLCHVPPGNPDNAHTICVGSAAVPAHLAHGDTLGSCPGDGEPDTIKNLIMIDPATGEGTLLMALGVKFEGLAKAPDGTLYAARNDQLWRIDPFACPGLVLVGTCDFGDIEALEYAYGDGIPAIEVPGVPAAWTAGGVLFAFSDDENALLVFNPATAETVQLECALDTTDCEGLVFLTELSDPFGEIVFAPCD